MQNKIEALQKIVLENLPFQLDLECSCHEVNEQTGIALLELGNNYRFELGIQTVKKKYNKPCYEIWFSHVSKYNNYRKKIYSFSSMLINEPSLFMIFPNAQPFPLIETYDIELNNPLLCVTSNFQTDQNQAFFPKKKENQIIQPKGLEPIITEFLSHLKKRNTEVTKFFWEKNPILEAWFCSEKINVDPLGNQPDYQVIPFMSLLEVFRTAVYTQCIYIVKILWDKNPRLQEWYAGKPVNFASHEQIPVDRVITFKELTEIFESSLIFPSSYIRNKLWDMHYLLRGWYRGEKISINGQEKQCTDSELIKLFLSTLKKATFYIFNDIWLNNERLKKVIKHLPLETHKALFQRVIATKTKTFVQEYSDWLEKNCPDKFKVLETNNQINKRKSDESIESSSKKKRKFTVQFSNYNPTHFKNPGLSKENPQENKPFSRYDQEYKTPL